MARKKGKSPSESIVQMTEIVLPVHTNALHTMFGGTVMSWIDIAAAISAQRHARRVVVTASIDALHFRAPIKLGYIVHVRACVNRAFKTSMEVGVRVDSENPMTGEMHYNVKAYTTFVALNDHGNPVEIEPIIPKTPDEIRRFDQALKRRESRMRLAQDLKG
jgi:acyl-CoA hydrolase